MKTPILTYQKITKDEAVRLARQHRAEDRLIRGDYYKNGSPDWKGCSVGCFVKDADDPHHAWADLIGTVEAIPCIVDALFEKLPDPEHLDWHVAVHEGMPVGVDVTLVVPRWLSRILVRCEGRIGEGDEPWRVDCRKAVRAVRDILDQWAKTGINPADAALAAAASSARAAWAADADADADAAAAAARAAWAWAADADAAAAARAAVAAADSADERRQQAADFLKLLRDCGREAK